MPEVFRRGRPDFVRVLRLRDPKPATGAEQEVADGGTESPDGSETLGLLESDKPARRAKGLRLLAKAADPDLFEWCALLLDDESEEVRVAALEAMLSCEEIEDETLAPYAEAENKKIRGAAVATLARRSADDPTVWYRFGLIDPEPHVRLATARQLKALDPSHNEAIFNLALNDSNPKVVALAKRVMDG